VTGGAKRELLRKAEELRSAHRRGDPLVLPNAWDVASARAVAKAAFCAVATSSRAIAEVLGEADDDSTDPDVVFSFVARIAAAVSVPVTADVQAGYRLSPVELVERLLDAGLVGCNLEDTDHHGGKLLLDADEHAAYLADVRAASDRQGVRVFLNARVDTFIRQLDDHACRMDETIRRARLYLEAGADCIYPMGVSRREDAATLLSEIPGPLNLLARRGGLSIAELTELGASRISLASGVYKLVAARHDEILAALATSASWDDL